MNELINKVDTNEDRNRAFDEELGGKADYADNRKGALLNLKVPKWTLVVKQAGRGLKAARKRDAI